MKRSYFSKLIALTATFLGLNAANYAQTPCYNVGGVTSTYTVPSGCTAVKIDMAGAVGGTGNSGSHGGYGGRVVANLNVSTGQQLFVFVGGRGTNGNGTVSVKNGGPNGAGGQAFGGNGYYQGGGGGGATDIRVGGTALSSRVLVAGGGGGSGQNCNSTNEYGGDGGGLTGGTGYECGVQDPCVCGVGGTQTGAGGGSTCYQSSTSGGPNGYGGTNTSWTGGGGGGYWGGGIGYYGGGGGGSSYIAGSGVSGASTTSGYNNGDGYACITPLVPTVTSATPSFDFGTIPVGTYSVPQSTTITGSYLVPSSGTCTVSIPSNYEAYDITTSTWVSSLTINYSGAGFTTTLIIRFKPTAPITFSNIITVTGGGLTLPYQIPVTGAGSNTACSGTPTAGTTNVSPATGGTGTYFLLTLGGASSATGYTYQWQSSAASSGPWTNIPGAIGVSHVIKGISATTYYRCVVTCPSGSFANSTVGVATFAAGYYATGCSGTPSPGITWPTVTQGCSPFSTDIWQVGATWDSGIVHKWQTSADGLAWTDIPSSNVTAIRRSITSTVYYRDMITCLVSGASVVSNPQKITLDNPPSPIVGATKICSAVPSPFGDPTPSGTWSSSNIAIAQVDPTGLVTGVGGGTATISYTLTTGCYATSDVTVNMSPAALTGNTNVCTGLTTSLSSTTAGGAWSSSDITMATVDPSGVVTGVSVGIPYISYVMPSGCARVAAVNVNQQPAPIGGPSSVCEGASLTLTESISGGTWVSSNSFQVSVNSSTGFVTGILAGSSPTISYSLPGGCTVTKPMTVNSLPGAISGPAVVCQGSVVTLSDGGTGTWSSSNTSIATIVPSTGDITGVSGGTVTVTYTLSGTGCKATKMMNVNVAPTQFTVTGGGGYCAGGPGAHVGLSGSTVGINYDLYNSSGYVTTVAGSNSGLDFGTWPAEIYKVKGVDASGCVRNMSDSAIVVSNPLPTDFPMSLGSVNYCAGTGGVDVTISGSQTGVYYQLMYGSINSGLAVPGTGSGVLHFGKRTAAGNYTVVATNTSTLCSATMSGMTMININNNPVVYPISASATSYCAGGTGVEITMNTSDPTIAYYLYQNGVNTGINSMGNGSGPISFGFQTAAGTYTVVGYDGNTPTCTSLMSGSAPVSINTLPAKQTMTGGGTYCSGGSGAHIGLNYSVNGINYQLMNGGVLVSGTSKPGSNSALDFGFQTAAGAYTVLATNSITGCIDTMTGTKNININMPPTPYNVTGGGPYCLGTGGSVIGMISSDPGITYRLYRGSTLVGSAVGTGSGFPFGSFTTAGTYTVTAYDPSTGCSGPMTGSATVTISALPVAYKLSVSNGGHYCAGGTGVSIMLDNSDANVQYILYDVSGPVNSVTSTGGPINFGTYSSSGSYYATALNPAGCVNNMIGLVNITIDPLPAVYTVTTSGTGNYCQGGSGLHVKLSGSNKGINYQLSGPGGPLGAPIGGTNASLDFGVQMAAGNYDVVATNAMTGCQSNMSGPATINVIPLPLQYTLTTAALTTAENYCPGGTGIDLQLSGSDNGVDYKLYNNGSYVGHMYGAAAMLDFGYNPKGKYTVVATDTTYGCMSNMVNTVNIDNYALPNPYPVTGGGVSYCALDAGAPVGLGNSASGVKYQLSNTSGPVGAPIAGTSGSPISFGDMPAGTYTVSATDTTTTCMNNMTGSAVILAPYGPYMPTVTISSFDTICFGDSLMYSAKYTHSGTAPTFEWAVNGTTISSGSAWTFWHKPSKAQEDTITVMMTSTEYCISSSTANSNEGKLLAKAPVSPSVTASTPKTTVCASTTPVVFTAAGSNTGSGPIYQWHKNGVLVGTNSTSYSTAVVDSDVVFVVMASNAKCADKKFVYSTPIKMTVTDVVTPVFVIQSDPGVEVEKGTKVTFTALVSNVTSGATFTYQWSVGGSTVSGATNGVYTTSNYNNNDAVSCTVTSHNTCGTSTETHQVFMNVGTTGLVSVSQTIGNVSVVPNPNKGAFSVKGSLNSTTDQEATIEITNMLGQTVYSNKVIAKGGVIDEQINLGSNLANGMYLLNLRSGADTKVFHFVLEQ